VQCIHLSAFVYWMHYDSAGVTADPSARGMLRTLNAHMQAAMDYKPGPYDGKVQPTGRIYISHLLPSWLTIVFCVYTEFVVKLVVLMGSQESETFMSVDAVRFSGISRIVLLFCGIFITLFLWREGVSYF